MTKLFSLFVVCIAVLISSCSGWHLRGTDSSFINLEAVDLDLKTKNASLVSVINQVMESRGIENLSSANIRLAIFNEELDKRPLAYTATGIAAQYRLTMYLRYQRNDDAIQRISVSRNYDFNPSNLSAKREEEQALLNEMRRELAERVFVLISPKSQEQL